MEGGKYRIRGQMLATKGINRLVCPSPFNIDFSLNECYRPQRGLLLSRHLRGSRDFKVGVGFLC